mmetsp:Transcript_13957/g.23196  ORF Transcript_13957/g.23196 Transcript_13957/m.23196 type:complete len:220 (-) Transcript_13957:109-768(-)
MMAFRNLLLLLLSLLSQLIHQARGFGIVHDAAGRSSPSFARIQTQRNLATETTVVERLDLTDNFNRWKYMQNLLDEELEAQDVNQILFVLLDNYMNAPSGGDPADSSAPERTVELLEIIEGLLQYERSSIPAVKDPDCQPGDDEQALIEIEKLLPDPVEKEDAAKGAWDTVSELHGRTSLAYNEREGRPAWNVVCMVARVMIYFEFLTGDGLVSSVPKA